LAYPTAPLLPPDLAQFVADVIKRPIADIYVGDAGAPGRYYRQCQFYPGQAYAEVLGVLAARGYTASQFDTSDQGANDAAHWVRDLAAWLVLRDDANFSEAQKLEWQKEYDRREWLKTATLTSGGVPVAPASPLLKASYKAFADKYDRWTRDSRL
jgi:hypothetical protein